MFRLFENDVNFSRTTIRPPGLLYLTSELNKIIQRYVNYYQNVEQYINNTNQFARMLDMIRISTLVPEDEINGIIRDRSPVLSSMFDLTTYRKKGNAIYPGSFYGLNATEVWVGHDTPFIKDPKQIAYNEKPLWSILSPVKVIRHGHSVVTFPYLNGQYKGPKNELVVLSINIPMLAYQFYLWDKQTIKETGGLLPAEIFMTKVIVPSLISSHLEITMMNRLFNEVLGIPNDQGKWFSNPFYIQDLSSRLNGITKELAERISSQQMTYEEVLGSVPSILSSNKLHSVIRMPDSLITHHNRWAYLVAYLPVINFLVRLDNLQNNNRNLGYRGRTWQYIRFMRNDGTVVSAFSRRNPVMAGFIDAEMEEIKLSIENK
jgi:hypothetical protein